MNPFDELRKQRGLPVEEPKENLIWLSMLIKYELDGSATVLRSFARPAKESSIKGINRERKKEERFEIPKDDGNKEAKELF